MKKFHTIKVVNSITNSIFSFKCLSIFLFFLLFVFTGMKAQTLTWNHTYTGVGDNKGSGIEKTFDCNFIVSGITTNAAGVNVALLMKIDRAGDTLWTKTYDNIYNSGGLCVKQCNDSGFVIAGYKSNATGSLDFYIIKTISNGTVDWVRTYGGALNEGSYSIIQTYDSGFAVCGYTSSEGAGGKDVLLVKYNKYGTIQWHKTYGGTNDELAYALCQTPDSGYAIAGSTKSYSDNSLEDIYVIRAQPNGDSLWSQTYKHAGTDIALDIIRCKDDGYAICGKSNSTENNLYDMFILRIRDNGHQMFFKTYGTINNEAANAVREAGNSAFLLGGYTCNDNGTKTAAALWVSDYGDSLSWQVNEETQNNQITSFCINDDESVLAVGSINIEDKTVINNISVGNTSTGIYTGIAIGPLVELCYYPRNIWIQDCFQQKNIDNHVANGNGAPWHPELNILNDNFTYDCSNSKWDTVTGSGSWRFKEAALIAYINNGRFRTVTLGHLEDPLREDNDSFPNYPSLCPDYDSLYPFSACTASKTYDFANGVELRTRLGQLIYDLYNQTAVTAILAQWRDFDGYDTCKFGNGVCTNHNTLVNNYVADEMFTGGATTNCLQLFDYFKTFNNALVSTNGADFTFKGIEEDYEYWINTYGNPTKNYKYLHAGFTNFLKLATLYNSAANKTAGNYKITHAYINRVILAAIDTTAIVVKKNYFDLDGDGKTSSLDFKSSIDSMVDLNLDAYELAWFYKDTVVSNNPNINQNYLPFNFLLPLYSGAPNPSDKTADPDRELTLLRLFYFGHNASGKQVQIIPVFETVADSTNPSNSTLGNWLYSYTPWTTPHYFIDVENSFLDQSSKSEILTSDFEGTYSGNPPTYGKITTLQDDHFDDFGTANFNFGFSYFKYFMAQNAVRNGDATLKVIYCRPNPPEERLSQEIPTNNNLQNTDAKSVVIVSPNPFSTKTTLRIIGSRNTFIQAKMKIYNVRGVDVTSQFSLSIKAESEMELTALYALPGIYYIKEDALQITKLTLIPR